ncbi:hypothetical protein [Frisingicoccus sp.]|uniref:hypothetical protein n=1 Tax=Frisingicoccus sp. TaxID=1918627 RepID=UPI0015BD88A1
MTFYDGSKIHHWFPRVNRMSEDYTDYEDTPDTMIVDDRHDLPYIGDFPPKDDYSEHHFY